MIAGPTLEYDGGILTGQALQIQIVLDDDGDVLQRRGVQLFVHVEGFVDELVSSVFAC